ncbi:membrane protein [Actibacterium mucosum KCTC 23349]|uniref:Membrane protein n=1 Tax=Actibacterium mucosum KCTC 23349 TaxID=1454373 RepID=A0A037ZMC6_9RHOB|nr:YbaN family protein [Actibacterium mucosum]KAJ57254.1 membrane protein [Actibacterium mucosum KCTC 23349]
MRILWAFLGIVSVGLAMLGIPLPGLPTVPFLLLAAFCFSRSSERLHNWLISHPTFGPPIDDWREHGAIRRRVKWLASGSILAAFVISILLSIPPIGLIAQAVILSLVALFIWTRPEA